MQVLFAEIYWINSKVYAKTLVHMLKSKAPDLTRGFVMWFEYEYLYFHRAL